jgi:hypothetical protein
MDFMAPPPPTETTSTVTTPTGLGYAYFFGCLEFKSSSTTTTPCFCPRCSADSDSVTAALYVRSSQSPVLLVAKNCVSMYRRVRRNLLLSLERKFLLFRSGAFTS